MTAVRDGRWQVVSIASGNEEERYTRAAGRARTAFREPQTNSWYTLSGDRVQPLDAIAKQMLGASDMPLATYQRKVAASYGDQLAGSAYDAQGLGGGSHNKTGARQITKTVIPEVLAALTGLALLLSALIKSRGVSKSR
ncbi:hypothetical protein [Streptomyces vinaceus]|uniref:hypothetical protein n=1 Tax=Streptomyces vinaceus TaxID=1960 RepID=UPI003676E000